MSYVTKPREHRLGFLASEGAQAEIDEIEDGSPEHRLPSVELLARIAGE